MPTDVVMPQMGESVAEGTIVRWIKKVGDPVDRDEPLFEISTDKVDAEIPSPAAGVLTEIRAKEGETVAVNSVVAVIGAAGEAKAAAPSEPSAAPPAPAPRAATPEPPKAAAPAPPAASAAKSEAAAKAEPAPALREEPHGDEAGPQRSSPLVRKIAKEHNVDISKIRGTGISGRVTKDDILAFIGGGPAPAAAAPPTAGANAPARPSAPPMPAVQRGVPGQTEKMSVMRKRIAEHMIASKRTSAHVHSVFEVNFSRVASIRAARKAEYERAGVKVTFLSFILKAACDALRAVPVVNASVDGDNIVYHQDVNMGVAVALDWGLIVPVVKKADEKNLIGLSRSIADLAVRARTKQLKPEEVSGGTFTVTNPGVFGALFGMPIINQPQVAILGVGHIEKRPIVVEDAIAIRPMGYLSLGYDHRIIDGAVADEFMSHVKHRLENWDPTVD
jgi:2-oxoglutarate dehydrogenase E2 component (dihydrolipoamide succinyltransferase)